MIPPKNLQSPDLQIPRPSLARSLHTQPRVVWHKAVAQLKLKNAFFLPNRYPQQYRTCSHNIPSWSLRSGTPRPVVPGTQLLLALEAGFLLHDSLEQLTCCQLQPLG